MIGRGPACENVVTSGEGTRHQIISLCCSLSGASGDEIRGEEMNNDTSATMVDLDQDFDYNKIWTQFEGCWVVHVLINYLIISNTVFQIVMSQSNTDRNRFMGSGSHLGHLQLPGLYKAKLNLWGMVKEKRTNILAGWASVFPQIQTNLAVLYLVAWGLNSVVIRWLWWCESLGLPFYIVAAMLWSQQSLSISLVLFYPPSDLTHF